jgi:glycosyltransferase involved in cell wall biosynthesis
MTASPRPGLPVPRFVFAGRLERDKGADLLVEALGRLGRPVATFVLGDGSLRHVLERRARELGLDGAITFPGWCWEPGSWIAGAAALVVPSRQEAFSQSAALAMALGTPVVATAVEGLPRVLGDGRGVLVAPGDPDALAAALRDVLDGRHRLDLAAARAYAAQFAPALVGLELAAEYATLARRAR